MSPTRKSFKTSTSFTRGARFQEKPTAQSHHRVGTENECIFVAQSNSLRFFPGDAANEVPRQLAALRRFSDMRRIDRVRDNADLCQQGYSSLRRRRQHQLKLM